MTDFVTILFDVVQNTNSYLLLLNNFWKGPRNMQNEIPAEVPEDSQVLRMRRLCCSPPIASLIPSGTTRPR